jgi:3-hydroxyacyl-[acyl-carrier-protein] dehydratase
VTPGHTLTIDVSIIKRDDRFATLKVAGRVGDRLTLSGRLVLERYNLADHDPTQGEIDQQIKARFRLAQKVLVSSDAMTITPA